MSSDKILNTIREVCKPWLNGELTESATLIMIDYLVNLNVDDDAIK
uniref:Uncharacterized protein n=1 Tax=viral metagenome TaxID=1070528 RepID=A0A6H1ZA89_9ZZZZ